MSHIFPYPYFKLDNLNGFILLAIIFFFILTVIYSVKLMRGKPQAVSYYIYIVLSAVVSFAAALSNNLILLLACWGFLGLLLYLLINMGDEGADKAARKALIIVGGSDALMILGIGIIYYFTRTFQMDIIKLGMDNALLAFAYVCICIGCFAKAGAFPFQGWVPGCAKSAPVGVNVFLLTCLDKLLAVYLLMRVSYHIFSADGKMNVFLMSIGALSIALGAIMALMQRNMNKLLGFSSISQAGYMILGIGSGNPVGIAGALFHVINHAVYKSCLFFCSGNVEYRARSAEFDKLGGLGKAMPLTYISCLIAGLSVSGIPPFNGFVSKWLIYQGVISNILGSLSVSQLIFCIFCLLAAMFGSALTLAAIMKLLHAVFLGERLNVEGNKTIKEVSAGMWGPGLALAFICVIFGVFAFILPLKYLIFPAVGPIPSATIFIGVWSPVQATLLIGLGLIDGLVIFRMISLKSGLRQDSVFTGGERQQPKEAMVTGVEFYNTIEEMPFLRRVYKRANAGIFDIYEQGKKLKIISKPLVILHNGILPTYLVWMLLGMLGLFFFLAR